MADGRRPTPRSARSHRAEGRVQAAQHVLLRLHEEHLEGWHLHQDGEAAGHRHDLPVQADAARAVGAARASRRGALGGEGRRSRCRRRSPAGHEAGMGIKFVYDSADQRDQLEQIVEKMMTDSLGPLIYSRLVKKRPTAASRDSRRASVANQSSASTEDPAREAQPMNISSPPARARVPVAKRAARQADRKGWGGSPRRCGGEVARDDGRHHEAVAAEAADDVEAGHAGQLADDRVAVGADVVGPRPLAHDLDVRRAAASARPARAPSWSGTPAASRGGPRRRRRPRSGIEMPPTSSPRSDCET